MTDLTPEEIRMVSAMRAAAKTRPDLCAVAALQDLASLYLKIEPLLTEPMKATLFGVGTFIAEQADKEMRAMAQAMVAIDKARAGQ